MTHFHFSAKKIKKFSTNNVFSMAYRKLLFKEDNQESP